MRSILGQEKAQRLFQLLSKLSGPEDANDDEAAALQRLRSRLGADGLDNLLKMYDEVGGDEKKLKEVLTDLINGTNRNDDFKAPILDLQVAPESTTTTTKSPQWSPIRTGTIAAAACGVAVVALLACICVHQVFS